MFRKQALVLVLLGVFLSCKKDQPPVIAATIVGKWYLKSHQREDFRNGVNTGDETHTDFSVNDFEIFNTDSTALSSSLTPDGLTAFYEYDYTLSGTVMTITRNTGTFRAGRYVVSGLTADTLKLRYESASVINGDNYQGIDKFLLSRK